MMHTKDNFQQNEKDCGAYFTIGESSEVYCCTRVQHGEDVLHGTADGPVLGAVACDADWLYER